MALPMIDLTTEAVDDDPPDAPPVWFADSPGRSLMSHNGCEVGDPNSGTLYKEGSLPAFLEARRLGYRRMQVDALAYSAGLFSRHSRFGRGRRYRKLTKAQLHQELGREGVVTLDDLLGHPELRDVAWNIELKSKRGLGHLKRLLDDLEREGRDLGSVLISAPMSPKVLREVSSEFPEVKLAAPVAHGGAFGIRLPQWRWLPWARRMPLPARGYDCAQLSHLLIWPTTSRIGKALRPLRFWKVHDGDWPVRQAWTIRQHRTLERVLRAGAHGIVQPRRVWVGNSAAVARPPEKMPEPTETRVLALGGGGWRGAFGGIGAVMYLRHKCAWSGIREAIGISGGAFAVGKLSSVAAHNDPAPAMQELLARLIGNGRRLWSVIGFVVVALVAVVAAAIGSYIGFPVHNKALLATTVLAYVALTTMTVRTVVAGRWRFMVRKIFPDEPNMRQDGPPEPGGQPRRRDAIGAISLHDGNLYCFTTDAEREVPLWRDDRARPVPLEGRPVWWAVQRSGSLPGLGQLGTQRLYLPTCAHPAHGKTDHMCSWVPDRLVDGGLAGIFGRKLVQAREHAHGLRADRPVDLLVVDAGRSLANNGGASMTNRLSRTAERVSTIMLLARWLMVSFEVSYRGELSGARDGREVDGYRSWLVRLAEPEADAGKTSSRPPDSQRGRDLERLRYLRDRVHRFSLMRANELNANRTMAAAIAGCALEFEVAPDIPAILRSIDGALNRQGLAQVWDEIPLL